MLATVAFVCSLRWLLRDRRLRACMRQGPPAALVAVSPVVEREVTAGQTFVGTVMPLKKAVVGSAVDGRVIEFPLNEGDRVERGGSCWPNCSPTRSSSKSQRPKPSWSFASSSWPSWKTARGRKRSSRRRPA